MITLDNPGITNLFIPKSTDGGCCGVKTGIFTKKDILEILTDYITVESATTILDQIFTEYIAGDNNLTELVLNAVGDVYTTEQVDQMVSELETLINGMDYATEDWVEDQGYLTGITITVNGQEVHNGDSVTIDSGEGKVDETTFNTYTGATDTRITAIENQLSTPPATFIYVDDFPDASFWESWGFDPARYAGKSRYCDEWAEDFYGYDTMADYLDAYLANKGDMGCNPYFFAGELTFEGADYWLYRRAGGDYWQGTPVFGLLPKTVTVEELESHSIANNYDNLEGEYTPFTHYLTGDASEYDVTPVSGERMPNLLVDFM